MPVKRQYASVPINLATGGRLLPDLPVGLIGAANFDEKVNWVSEIGEIRKRSGWDYPAPMGDWDGDGLADFDDGNPAEAIAAVPRPNGTYAVVGAGGGKIKVFDYDLNSWDTIGSGFSTKADAGFRWWQIVDVAGYAVFNNGRDLPVLWQVGDATVTPLYELREAGYASVGLIVEYVDGVLMCADILEINDEDMSAVMNNVLPYKTIVDSAETTRITFRRVWSNEGDPGDFAANVPGTVTLGSPNLTLAWPMASFQAGDEVIVNGAGTAGGNLTTTILTISGVNVVLANNALTAVSSADVYKSSALNSIVGFDDIEDDGSAIVLQIPLKTQLISFKASGHIWQTYYTGDLDTPFAKDRVTKKPGIAPRFPRAVVNIVNDDNEEYLLFPGAKHFYRFDLGSQAPQQAKLFMGAEKELFFSRIKGLGKFEVWAADNTCTDEIFFAYLWEEYETGYYGANRAVALKYAKDCESISEVDGFNFTCAAPVQKPLAGFHGDDTETWFLMGDGDGKITLYGETNLEVLTRRRYGEKFDASIGGGLTSFGVDDTGKYVRRFSITSSKPDASQGMEVTIYGTRSANVAPVVLETRTLTDPRFPGAMGLYYRKPYYKYRIVADTDGDLRIAGFVWRVGAADTQDIDQLE